MDGGPPAFPRDFTCPAVLWIQLAIVCFKIRDSHPLRSAFPRRSHNISLHIAVLTPIPRRVSVWPAPRSLATTCGISVDVFSSPYLDVSVQAVPHIYLFYSVYVDRVVPCRVSPFGYLRIYRVCAAPRSFSQLVTSFFGSWCLGIRPTLFVA